MLDFESDTGGGRVPVTVVAGASEGACVRLLGRLDFEAAGGGVLAIVNGPMKQAPAVAGLVEHIDGRMVPHAVGCLCCVGRSPLTDALRGHYARRSHGESRFARVVIELEPGDDPAPVLQTLLNNALVTQYYRLDGLVAVLNGAASTSLQAGVRKAVAMADRVLWVGEQPLPPSLAHEVAVLAPAAMPVIAETAPRLGERLTGCGYHDAVRDGNGLGRWLGAESLEQAGPGAPGERVQRFCVDLPSRMGWEGFHTWIDAGMRMNGDVIWRVRGVVALEGEDGPILVQGVQQVLQPPVRLPAWGDLPRRSRLSFVTCDLDRAAVVESLARDLPVFDAQARERQQRRIRAMADPSLPA